MRQTALAFALLAFCSTPLLAQTKAEGKDAKSPAQAAQQQRMKDCNADAKGMKGEQRSGFMSSCLKGETGEKSGRTAQQNKMSTCNKEASAKSMKGDDRRKFMSECLKG